MTITSGASPVIQTDKNHHHEKPSLTSHSTSTIDNNNNNKKKPRTLVDDESDDSFSWVPQSPITSTTIFKPATQTRKDLIIEINSSPLRKFGI